MKKFKEIQKTVKEKIKDFFYYEFYRRGVRGVERTKIMARYIKLGWTSHDYDYGFALDEFLDKIRRVGEHLVEHDIRLNTGRDFKTIKEAIYNIEKGRDLHDFYDEFFEPKLIKKYGHSVSYTARAEDWGNSEADVFKKYKGCSMSFSKREKETYKNYKQLQKDQKKAYDGAEKMRKKAWDRGWGIIRDEIMGWWD